MPKRAESDKPGGKPFRKETETMEAIFKSLKQTTNRLNTTADAANDLIRLANERLASIGAGVAYASSNLRLKEDVTSRFDEAESREVEAGCEVAVLAYDKINGTWQLGIELQSYVTADADSYNDYDLIRTSHIPLLSVEREMRIRAASWLPKFLREYTQYLNGLADKLNHE